MARYFCCSFLIVCTLFFSPVLCADKTDVVFLHNGDRITGEVKSLFRGKLEFSTDSMGTIYIEWEDIMELISATGQSVELSNGQRFYGPLDKPENQDVLMVTTDQGAVGVDIDDVTNLYPVEAGFWDRLDVDFSLGFSWDKGSNVGKYNIGLNAEYRNPRFISSLGFSGEVTTQDESDDNSRANLEGAHMVFRPNRRFHTVFGNIERNEELGIDLRTLVGAGYGWFPIRDQRKLFSIALGADINHEKPISGEAETNLEAVARMNFDYFKYSTPERRFRTELIVFPSVTDLGRVRANFNLDYRWELVKDLFWSMDFYTAYDSAPISEQASTIDYGVNSAIGYKF